LFAEEQERIRRERNGARKQTEHLSFKHERVLEALDTALAMTDDIQQAYVQAGPGERRLFNQGLYERLEISEEEVVGDKVAEPFDRLLALKPSGNEATEDLAHLDWDSGKTPKAAPGSIEAALSLLGNARTPDQFSKVGGSNVEKLVELGGFEPPTSWVRSNGAKSER
jgi:hypothetical protein